MMRTGRIVLQIVAALVVLSTVPAVALDETFYDQHPVKAVPSHPDRLSPLADASQITSLNMNLDSVTQVDPIKSGITDLKSITFEWSMDQLIEIGPNTPDDAISVSGRDNQILIHNSTFNGTIAATGIGSSSTNQIEIETGIFNDVITAIPRLLEISGNHPAYATRELAFVSKSWKLRVRSDLSLSA